MPTSLYVETSAVLAWLFGEPTSERVVALMNAADLVVSSTLTLIETDRAAIRAERTGLIPEATARRIMRIANDAFRSWQLLEITQNVQKRAREPFPIEPIRSLDALHLSSMLTFAELHEDLSVLSLDKRITDNLGPLGLVGV